jgi:signal peptidase I
MRKTNRWRKAAHYLWQEWLRPVAVTAAILFPLRSAVADWNWVPTGSMKPTILEGDLVFVNKLAYDLKVPFTCWHLAEWDNPSRGDIVVFFSPKDGTRLVKRVIAGPGDTIEMHDNVLFINGRKLDYEPSASHHFDGEIYEDSQPIVARERNQDDAHWVMALPSRAAMRSFPLLTVPSGKYFVMGDSRDNSFDSRYFGVVDRKQIVGRANRVLLSLDKNHFYVPRLKRFLSAL